MIDSLSVSFTEDASLAMKTGSVSSAIESDSTWSVTDSNGVELEDKCGEGGEALGVIESDKDISAVSRWGTVDDEIHVFQALHQ